MLQAMTPDASLQKLNDAIESLCPRDSHVMRYHAKGLEWPSKAGDQAMPCYHCEYEGCSVCYAPYDGYFTVIDTPDLPQAVEEPGVNVLRCPRHNGWLYRSFAENQRDRLVWRCGVERCDYTRPDFGPVWPSL